MQQAELNPNRLPHGRLLITPNALRSVPRDDVQTALCRHMRGDCGNFNAHGLHHNKLSLAEGFRLLSAYRASNGTKFWVISEADHSRTNVKLHISSLMLSLQKC